MTAVIPERLKAIEGIKCSVGAHEPPPPGEPPCAFCVKEKYSWVTGQPWSDRPPNCSPVISAFLRRYNDATDQDGRDQIDLWIYKEVDGGFPNVDRLAASAKDGKDWARGYMVADKAARTFLPLWLELAGATEAATTMRALPPITNYDSARVGRDAARQSRQGLPDWWAWHNELRAKVRAAVAEALKDKPAAAAAATAADAADDAATAATAADATAAATAATATDAAADAAAAAADADAATAADDAAAAAAAAADAAADAAAADAATAAAAAAAADAATADAAAAAADAAADAAAADAAADAATDATATWNTTYNAVYKAVRERLGATFAERWAPAVVPVKAAVLVLLEELVSL